MKTIFAVIFATVYGLILRIVYGFLNELLDIMSIGFLLFSPIAVGFLTVFLLPKKRRLSNTAAFFIPWLTSLGILFITMIFDIEGSICWIMIFPFFVVAAGIGGLWAVKWRRKKYGDNEKIDFDFDKPDGLKVSFVLLIPLIIGLVEGDKTTSKEEFTISKSSIVAAPANQVWYELTHINDINTKEKKYSFATMMGFPKHVQTTLDTLCVGGKRKAVYERGLYFDETIAAYEKEKLLVLDIKTDPTNIPPTVMDEHIVIGGKHLDILRDTYTLEAMPDQSCRLTLSSRFYINTPINWYAGIWAKYLMSDILQSELNMITERATTSHR